MVDLPYSARSGIRIRCGSPAEIVIKFLSLLIIISDKINLISSRYTFIMEETVRKTNVKRFFGNSYKKGTAGRTQPCLSARDARKKGYHDQKPGYMPSSSPVEDISFSSNDDAVCGGDGRQVRGSSGVGGGGGGVQPGRIHQRCG
jgi:hypothetical protein